MDSIVIRKIGEHFLFLGRANIESFSPKAIVDDPLFFEDSIDAHWNKKKVVSGKIFKNYGIDTTYDYRVETHKDLILLNKLSIRDRLNLIAGCNLRASKKMLLAQSMNSAFTAFMKTTLFNSLLGENAVTSDYIRAFAHYTFYTNYSFWLFNPETSTFTCTASSKPYPKSYAKLSDDPPLKHILKSGKTVFHLKQNNLRGVEEVFGKVRSVTRMVLKFDHGVKGILTFYSERNNFFIKEDLCRKISDAVSSKFHESIQRGQRRLDNVIGLFREPIKADKNTALLSELVQSIANNLKFEAVSIFLEKQKGQLSLIATYDRYSSGNPSEMVSYPVSGNTMTASVYKTKKTRWSYDLEKEPDNTGPLCEDCSLGNRTWVGIPIMSNNKVHGVLRAKNKYRQTSSSRELDNLLPFDVLHLETVCHFLAGTLATQELLTDTEQQKQELDKKILDQQVFNRMFMHEIRTPLNTFFSAPQRIKRELTRLGLPDERIAPIQNKLSDIETLANRLKFIANAYSIETILSSKKLSPLMLLRDVVYPVINITKPYIWTQTALDVQFDPRIMQNVSIFGDQRLLQIVLNALIDNAAKYSLDEKRPITVKGTYTKTNEFYLVSVENFGLEISKDEINRIFKYGERGNLANDFVEGTGIGLFLSKNIMEEHSGDLVLTSRKNPVRFTMKIPTAQEVIGFE